MCPHTIDQHLSSTFLSTGRIIFHLRQNTSTLQPHQALICDAMLASLRIWHFSSIHLSRQEPRPWDNHILHGSKQGRHTLARDPKAPIDPPPSSRGLAVDRSADSIHLTRVLQAADSFKCL